MHWGKSRIPLYFLIFSSIFNVILDIIMVTKMDMGVAGVAWATLIAQGISAVLSFGVLLKNLKGLEGKQKTLFDKMELAEMTRIAIPSILQQSTVSIGMMLVQSVVNGFGSEALAGFSQPCVLSQSALYYVCYWKCRIFFYGPEHWRRKKRPCCYGASRCKQNGHCLLRSDLLLPGSVQPFYDHAVPWK